AASFSFAIRSFSLAFSRATRSCSFTRSRAARSFSFNWTARSRSRSFLRRFCSFSRASFSAARSRASLSCAAALALAAWLGSCFTFDAGDFTVADFLNAAARVLLPAPARVLALARVWLALVLPPPALDPCRALEGAGRLADFGLDFGLTMAVPGGRVRG